MARWVIKAVHSSDQCPTANSKVRQLMTKSLNELPQLAQRLNVRVLFGPLMLGVEHEALIIVEAERYEAVQDMVLQSGLVQWNDVHILGAMSMEQVMQTLEKVPPPLY